MSEGNSGPALLAAIAAIASAAAAWSAQANGRAQTKLADAKLKADLFDRRFAIWKAISGAATDALLLLRRAREVDAAYDVEFDRLFTIIRAEVLTAELLFARAVSEGSGALFHLGCGLHDGGQQWRLGGRGGAQ
jgi:hypothetical protein